MDASRPSSAVRSEILELVGSGHTAADIRERLAGQASEKDLQYADSLVKVRDQVRHERMSTSGRRAVAA
jgi:hypothetical protein